MSCSGFLIQTLGKRWREEAISDMYIAVLHSASEGCILQLLDDIDAMIFLI